MKHSCHGDGVSCDSKDSLYNKTSTLLGRITSQVIILILLYIVVNDAIIDQVTSNAEVWRLSAYMHLKAKPPNYEKVNIQFPN